MTEREWLACEEPADMVKYLRGKVSDRKLRLFAVASCRWAWDRVAPPENRRIVEEVEACIDQPLGEVGIGLAARTPITRTVTVEDFLVRGLAQDDAWEAAHSVAFRVPRLCWTDERHTWTMGYKAVNQIVREVFGNPFRPAAFDAAWRTPGVVSAAQAAYENRSLPAGTLEPARLALLADALEEAGCANADLLGHLRGDGPHVRGCWAVDLCLGKE
jgi:hypothetical protein